MRKIHLIAAFAMLTLIGLAGGKAQALTLSPPTSEISAKPGETVQVVAKLYNEGNSAETLLPSVYSFTSKNETGQPDFYDDKSGLGLQNWISLPSSVSLAPQERKSVVMTIAVPKSADPGGHYASVFWGSTPTRIEEGTGIEGRIAMLILVNVEGNVKEDARIIDFHAASPFVTHLPADFVVRVQNAGSVHVHPAGDIIIRNMFGRQSAVLPFNIQPATGNVLPKSIRRYDVSWAKATLENGASEWSKEWKNFAFGYYTAELDATYGSANTLATAKTGFWVFPWMVSIVGLVVLVIAWFLLRSLLRQYNRHVIDQYSRGKLKK